MSKSMLLAASTLTFDEDEKQNKYEIISFEEVHAEVIELKVVTLLMPRFNWCYTVVDILS